MTSKLVVMVDERVNGFVQFFEEPDPDACYADIDIFIAPDRHGAGLGTEAMEVALGHLFEDRGHHRVTLTTSPENERAIHVYEKLGFRRVGVLRKSERDPNTGEWRDELLMELVVLSQAPWTTLARVLTDPVRGDGLRHAPRVPSLSVVLPAYNEEANIGPMVDAAVDVLPNLADDYEVIIVDDGSKDATSSVARDLVDRHYPAVRLLGHRDNLGYGVAIRTGFQHSRGDLVFYTDADRQFDIAELAYLLPLTRENDLVIGFRVYRYDTVLRSIVSWVYNRIVGLMFRVGVRDVDCSFKLMRREVVDKLPLQSDDFFIDTEIVACARKWNFSIAQKGVRHYPRVAGETTVRFGDVPRTLRTVGRMWRRIYVPTKNQRLQAEATATRRVATEYIPTAARR